MKKSFAVLSAVLLGTSLLGGCMPSAYAPEPSLSSYTAQVVDAAMGSVDWDEVHTEVKLAWDYAWQEADAAVREALADIDWDELQKEAERTREQSWREANAAAKKALAEMDWDAVYEEDGKRQAIEVQTLDGAVLRTMTEKRDIVDFVRGERIEDWRYRKSIPADAVALYQFVSKQERTKTVVGRDDDRLYVVNVTTLYQNADGYYIRSHTTEEVPLPYPVPDIYAQIADEAGVYLVSLAQAG